MNTLYPFQAEAVKFAMKRQGSILAMEAGTGKTIVSCGVINEFQPTFTIIVCPAFLTLNWKRELGKWTTEKVRIITPDNKDEARNLIGVTIISYEMLRKLAPWYMSITFDLVIFDESHLIMNQNSLRSKAARLLKGRKKICLSGTPMMSRPIQMWHQLHILNPVRWSSYWDFALKYCNATKTYNGYWNVSGSNNSEPLNSILRKEIMLRMTKTEVLGELPEKIRQIIEIPCENYRTLLDEEKKFYTDLMRDMAPQADKANNLTDTFGNDYQDELSHMKGNNLYNINQLATLRKKTAMIKVPAIVEHIKNLLHQGQKIVVFTHHHCVTDELRKHLDGALWADGRIKAEERDGVCYRFQVDSGKRVLIAGIHALGVGVTLTEATVAIIAELDYTPSIITQAEDRIHRLGLTHGVLIQHMVLQGSIDIDIAKMLIEKQSVINQVIK